MARKFNLFAVLGVVFLVVSYLIFMLRGWYLNILCVIYPTIVWALLFIVNVMWKSDSAIPKYTNKFEWYDFKKFKMSTFS